MNKKHRYSDRNGRYVMIPLRIASAEVNKIMLVCACRFYHTLCMLTTPL